VNSQTLEGYGTKVAPPGGGEIGMTTTVERDARGRLIIVCCDRWRLMKLREWWAWRLLGRVPRIDR
jgi:hypothetical protein